MLNNLSLRNRLFACIAAGGLCLAGVNNVQAGDCGCEVTCDVCPTTEACGCENSCGCDRKNNCVYKALDAVAGGIEKLFGLDKCGKSDCDTMLCDDGCDAMLMEELMMPAPPQAHYSQPSHGHSHSTHSHSTHGHSTHAHSYPQHVEAAPLPPSPPIIQSAPVYSEPAESTGSALRMTQPRMVQPRAVAPRSVQPRSMQPRSMEQSLPAEPEPRSLPVPESTPNAAPEAEGEGGSLFDALSNPFGDDEARVRLPRPVRPSSYQEIELRPISKRPLSRSYSTSKRRVSNER